ncbi:hypothetical protein EJ08DRAFT_594728, partial [Tothia fuscella]
SSSQSFIRFWLSEECRNTFLSHLDQKTLTDFRLVCHDFGARAAPFAFKDIATTFKSSTFTKPGRVVALSRIGHHVRSLTFRMPHTTETFLPPLLDPLSGEQRNFTYVPQVERPSSSGSKDPKYGSQEITELLIQQYPPLFHAATNIPAFIRAFSFLPNLAHLTVSCPGQEDVFQKYRRSTVDYALISLRIALERAPLFCFDSLSLDSVHPAALFYLQPVLGIGSSPNSNKRWSQIRSLAIEMPSFSFEDAHRTEQLRIMHSYLRTFSENLTKLSFRWVGSYKGPSPLSLDREPVLYPPSWPRTPDKDQVHSRSPKPLKFRQLEYMDLENAVMDSSQIASFISRHKRTLLEFSFEEVTLRSGDWDDALEPLRKLISRRNQAKLRKRGHLPNSDFESMDVPCVFGPIDVVPELRVAETLAPRGIQHAHRSGMSRWLDKRRSNKKQPKKDWGGTEHLKKVMRIGAFTWV